MAWIFFVLVATVLINSSYQQEVCFPDICVYSERLNFQLEQRIVSYVREEVAYTAYAAFYERADVSLPGFSRLFTCLATTARRYAFKLTDLVNMRGGKVIYPVVQLKDGCRSIRSELNRTAITKPKSSLRVTVPSREKPYICYFMLRNWDADKEILADKKNDDPAKVDNKKTQLKSTKPRKTRRRERRSIYDWFMGDSPPVVVTQTIEDKSKDDTEDRNLWQPGLYGLEDALALERYAQKELIHIIQMAWSGPNCDPQIKHNLTHDYLSDQVEIIYKVAKLVEPLQRHQSFDTYDLEEYLLNNDLESKYDDDDDHREEKCWASLS